MEGICEVLGEGVDVALDVAYEGEMAGACVADVGVDGDGAAVVAGDVVGELSGGGGETAGVGGGGEKAVAAREHLERES